MSLHHNQDIRKMGGLKSKLPVTYACFLIGTLCIIGFPLTSGFFSKDLILEVMLYEETTISFIAYIMLLIGALVTTIYSLRLMFIVFYGKYRGGDVEEISEQSNIILIPLILLATLSLTSGYIIKVFVDLPIFMYGIKDIHYDGMVTYIEHGILSPATLTLVLGFFIAKKLYKDNKEFLFLENNFLVKIKKVIKTKYKFDELFLYSSDVMKKTSIFVTHKLDIGIIENVFVNGVPKKINSFSKILKKTSSGYLYHYAFSIVFSLVVIFGIILVRVL